MDHRGQVGETGAAAESAAVFGTLRDPDALTEALWGLVARRIATARPPTRAGGAPGIGLTFEPIIDSWTETVEGHEARRCSGGVAPADLAGSGHDIDLQHALVEEACREAALWPAPLSLSVTISPIVLQQPGFCQRLREMLHATGLAPARLELTVRDIASAAACRAMAPVLEALRGEGVRIGLAEFGTASANLACLGQLPLDRLNISRALVAAIDGDGSARAIVRAIIELAAELGIDVLAQGVATASQLRFLRSSCCRHVQGSLLARPVEAAALRAA